MKELIPSEAPGTTACPAAFPLVFAAKKKERSQEAQITLRYQNWTKAEVEHLNILGILGKSKEILRFSI